MENYFECMWDMYCFIFFFEVLDVFYLDEFYWFDKDDFNLFNCCFIYKQGNCLEFDGDFIFGIYFKELVKLVMEIEEFLGVKMIEEVFLKEFFESNFWIYWVIMFVFEKWYLVIEMC